MNNYIDANTITEILDKLIGPTWAVGDTIADGRRLENLKALIQVTDWCIGGVKMSAEHTSHEASVWENARTARMALLAWQEQIEEVLNVET